MSLGAAAGSWAWLHLGPTSLPAVALGFIACSMATFALSRRAERVAAANANQRPSPLSADTAQRH